MYSIYLNQPRGNMFTLHSLLVITLLSIYLEAVAVNATPLVSENENGVMMTGDNVYTSWNKRFSPEPAPMEELINYANGNANDQYILGAKRDGGGGSKWGKLKVLFPGR